MLKCAMNKLYYPTDLFLPTANTLCNDLAPISCNMGALSTFLTKIALHVIYLTSCCGSELFTYIYLRSLASYADETCYARSKSTR